MMQWTETTSQSCYYENGEEVRMTNVSGDLTHSEILTNRTLTLLVAFVFPPCWLRKGISWENIDDKDEWVSLLSFLIGRQIFGDADFISMIK